MLNIPLCCAIYRSEQLENWWCHSQSPTEVQLLLVYSLNVSCWRHSLQPSLHSEPHSRSQGRARTVLSFQSLQMITPCKGAQKNHCFFFRDEGKVTELTDRMCESCSSRGSMIVPDTNTNGTNSPIRKTMLQALEIHTGIYTLQLSVLLLSLLTDFPKAKTIRRRHNQVPPLTQPGHSPCSCLCFRGQTKLHLSTAWWVQKPNFNNKYDHYFHYCAYSMMILLWALYFC